MEDSRHQLRSVGFSTIEAVTEDNTARLMICLQLRTYLDQPGHPTQHVDLPEVAMSPDAALALCEALRAHVEAQSAARAAPPAGSQAH